MLLLSLQILTHYFSKTVILIQKGSLILELNKGSGTQETSLDLLLGLGIRHPNFFSDSVDVMEEQGPINCVA